MSSSVLLQTIGAKDRVRYRFQQDTGLQAAYTDPINSIFNSFSPQPQRTLVLGYTHLFSPTLVNQFNPGASWYASIFEPNNFPQVQQTFPIVLAGGERERSVLRRLVAMTIPIRRDGR